MIEYVAVYAIVNTLSWRVYVGGSSNFDKRIWNHFISLRNGNHENKYLQQDYNLHGEEVFAITVLETCTKEELKEREQFWLDNLDNKYNVVLNARGGTGMVTLSEKHKRRIGESSRGNKGNRDSVRTEEWRRNLSEAGKRYWSARKGDL